MRRIIGLGLLVAAMSLVGGSAAVAGQPNVSCQNPAPGQVSNPPPGQNSPGFSTVAVNVYAGSPMNPTVTKGVGNAHAVSQYDISCYGGRSR
jgi:hypothetical protein